MSTDHAAKIRELTQWLESSSRNFVQVASATIKINQHLNALQAELAAERARVARLQSFAVAQREYIAAVKPSIGVPIDWPEVSARIDQTNLTLNLVELQSGDLPDDDAEATL